MPQEHRVLTKADKQKWAKTLNRIMSGVTGLPSELFQTFELTTKMGDDNTYARMSKDFRKLVIALRGLGYEFEYVASPELSPKNGLLHLHGIMRGDDSGIPRQRLLSELWEKIHGAKIVFIQHHRSQGFLSEMAKYCVKHMVKEFPLAVGFKGRLLMSKGWEPENNKAVRRVLINYGKDYALMHEGVDRWHISNELIRRWLNGEQVMISDVSGTKGKFSVIKKCERKGVLNAKI